MCGFVGETIFYSLLLFHSSSYAVCLELNLKIHCLFFLRNIQDTILLIYTADIVKKLRKNDKGVMTRMVLDGDDA